MSYSDSCPKGGHRSDRKVAPLSGPTKWSRRRNCQQAKPSLARTSHQDCIYTHAARPTSRPRANDGTVRRFMPRAAGNSSWPHAAPPAVGAERKTYTNSRDTTKILIVAATFVGGYISGCAPTTYRIDVHYKQQTGVAQIAGTGKGNKSGECPCHRSAPRQEQS